MKLIWLAMGFAVGRWWYSRPLPTSPEALRTLTRQAARWSVAATQDRNEIIAIMHANYGRAYSDALRQIATPAQIRAATGVDSLRLEARVTAIQDESVRRMVYSCPTVAPHETWLARIAGER